MVARATALLLAMMAGCRRSLASTAKPAFAVDDVVVSSAKQCESHSTLADILFGDRSEALMHVTQPQLEAKSASDGAELPSCGRWAGVKSCCRSEFFNAVTESSKDEQRRLATVADAYQTMLHVNALPSFASASHDSGLSPEDFHVKIAKMQGHVVEAVSDYIEGCEDQIRLYFSATLCETCNPQLGRRLTENKFMHVDKSACRMLWGHDGEEEDLGPIRSCKGAPTRIKQASNLLSQITREARSRPAAEDSIDQAQLHQQRLDLMREGLDSLAKRIDFYSNSKAFCENLAAEGYHYRPDAWGDVDQLHPAYAEKQLTTNTGLIQQAEYTQPETDQSKGHVRGIDACKDPCFTGPGCTESRVGPFPKQLVLLVADGNAQYVPLVGCRFPVDRNSQLARFKLVGPYDDTQETGEGRCDNEASPKFSDAPLHIPLAVSSRRYEWRIHVPVGAQGKYLLCFCTGPCWGTEGYVNRGQVHVSIAKSSIANDLKPTKLTSIEQRQERVMYGLHTDSGPGARCDMRWTKMTGATIKEDVETTSTNVKVTFNCETGFFDLVGPKVVECHAGIWFVTALASNNLDDLTLGKDVVNKLEGWKWRDIRPVPFQLPRCHSRPPCKPPSRELAGGERYIDLKPQGVVRSRCSGGRALHIGDQVLRGVTLEQHCVKGSWEPAGNPKCVQDKQKDQIYETEYDEIPLLNKAPREDNLGTVDEVLIKDLVKNGTKTSKESGTDAGPYEEECDCDQDGIKRRFERLRVRDKDGEEEMVYVKLGEGGARNHLTKSPDGLAAYSVQDNVSTTKTVTQNKSLKAKSKNEAEDEPTDKGKGPVLNSLLDQSMKDGLHTKTESLNDFVHRYIATKGCGSTLADIGVPDIEPLPVGTWRGGHDDSLAAGPVEPDIYAEGTSALLETTEFSSAKKHLESGAAVPPVEEPLMERPRQKNPHNGNHDDILRIRTWPVIFTEDTSLDPLVIDSCSVTRSCVLLGTAPSYTAEALKPQYEERNLSSTGLPPARIGLVLGLVLLLGSYMWYRYSAKAGSDRAVPKQVKQGSRREGCLGRGDGAGGTQEPKDEPRNLTLDGWLEHKREGTRDARNARFAAMEAGTPE